MAKRPAPGTTKTRLSPALSPECAAGLYEAMLADTIGMLAARTDCDTIIAVDELSSVEYFSTRWPELAQVMQGPGPLGDRLDNVLGSLLDQGYQQTFAINSDGPDLPPEHLTNAFSTLDEPDVDVVLGPTDDGGYYLIGWKARWRPMVSDVTMSTPEVFADTVRIAEQIGARVGVAPSWFDVDVIDDLGRLRASLEDSKTATADFIDSSLAGILADLPTPPS